MTYLSRPSMMMSEITSGRSMRRLPIVLVLALALLVHIVSGESSPIPHHSTSCTGGSQQTEDLEGKYSAIESFLTERDIQKSLDRFHIHGWRWHTASLVRESGRLCSLAQRAKSVEEAAGDGDDDSSSDTSTSMTNALQQAADYVVGFNMKGLHRIEADLMFPWMREKLTTINGVAAGVTQEFSSVMSQLESDRKTLVQLGDYIMQSATIANKDPNRSRRFEAIQDVIEKSASLQSCAKTMMDVEDTLLVPAIAKVVPEAEQHSFNNRVLRSLGILDSRLHLVAMYEAIEESGNPEEKALFERAIPSFPQMMIPRWKRKLYGPKAGVLDTEL